MLLNFWWKNILKTKKMGLIKEPAGVDFIIQSKPLTDLERKEISEYIQSKKMKQEKKKSFRCWTRKLQCRGRQIIMTQWYTM